jgi:hypothetical protein
VRLPALSLRFALRAANRAAFRNLNKLNSTCGSSLGPESAADRDGDSEFQWDRPSDGPADFPVFQLRLPIGHGCPTRGVRVRCPTRGVRVRVLLSMQPSAGSPGSTLDCSTSARAVLRRIRVFLAVPVLGLCHALENKHALTTAETRAWPIAELLRRARRSCRVPTVPLSMLAMCDAATCADWSANGRSASVRRSLRTRRTSERAVRCRSALIAAAATRCAAGSGGQSSTLVCWSSCGACSAACSLA